MLELALGPAYFGYVSVADIVDVGGLVSAVTIDGRRRFYDFQVSPRYGRQDRLVGRSVGIRDITSAANGDLTFRENELRGSIVVVRPDPAAVVADADDPAAGTVGPPAGSFGAGVAADGGDGDPVEGDKRPGR